MVQVGQTRQKRSHFKILRSSSYSGFIEDNPSGTMTKVVVVYSFVSKKSTNHKGQDDGDVQRSPLWGQGEDLC